jgi:Glu-tRNA(Gln) amidotransferase subunit E-like FAD-binding protein
MALDYSALGFKCGVEIHQQLETNKLFCNCPSIVRDDKADINIIRKLRAVAGESGLIDSAAAYEKTKEKEFKYEASSTSCCLVELDEEPPHQINKEALRTVLEVSLLLHAKVVDEIQFMRKTVIDGSNVSGFQRTALIAQDGYIETSIGKVNIPTICLEEEAAKKIEDSKDYTKYRLDRLGIALIELGTDASIKSPDHAKEVAETLGMILRSTGKVKRGLGTIRQDVNVSIKGGARTEIKGFQDLRSIPKVIEYEVQRQLQDIKLGKKIEESVRKAEPDLTTSFLRPMPGADRMYPETDVQPIRISKELLSSIKLPELITDRALKLQELGINKDVAKSIVKENKMEYFEILFNKYKSLKPAFIVDTFQSIRQFLKKDFKLEETEVKDEQIEKILALINEEKVPKNNLAAALADMINGTFDEKKYKVADDSELEKEIERIVKEKPGLNQGGYMGLIMARFKGKVDGKKAAEILKKFIK